jgi:hypothetical protein
MQQADLERLLRWLHGKRKSLPTLIRSRLGTKKALERG